jgi:hypothetical protein
MIQTLKQVFVKSIIQMRVCVLLILLTGTAHATTIVFKNTQIRFQKDWVLIGMPNIFDSVIIGKKKEGSIYILSSFIVNAVDLREQLRHYVDQGLPFRQTKLFS